jgi:iron complex transport system substrate-binding protein
MIGRARNWPDRHSIERVSAFLQLALCMLLASACDNVADPALEDDASAAVRRIITLAPHLTELVYAAGAGDRLVGAVEYSDYPPEASDLPRIGDAFRFDYEAIAALDPDLLLAWQSGTPVAAVERLTELGYRVVRLEPGRLATIAEHLRFIGQLAGSLPAATLAADNFDQELQMLRDRYHDATTLSVFYQISWQPLFTINKQHVIGEAIEICGGRNIFADLSDLSPAISLEAVLDSAPQVIIASRFDSRKETVATELSGWSKWANIPAVRDGNLFLLGVDQMARPSTRILLGIEALCQSLDKARQKIMGGNQPT